LRVAQTLAAHRHLDRAGLPDGLDEKAFVRIARHDGRPGLAAFEQAFFGIEAKTSHGRGVVAAKAAFYENRADILEKEIRLGRALSLERDIDPFDRCEDKECTTQRNEYPTGHGFTSPPFHGRRTRRHSGQVPAS